MHWLQWTLRWFHEQLSSTCKAIPIFLLLAVILSRPDERSENIFIIFNPSKLEQTNLPISWLQDREELNKAKLLSENLPSNFWSLHFVGSFDLQADYSNSFCINEPYPVWSRTTTMNIHFMMIIWKMNSHFIMKDRKASFLRVSFPLSENDKIVCSHNKNVHSTHKLSRLPSLLEQNLCDAGIRLSENYSQWW